MTSSVQNNNNNKKTVSLQSRRTHGQKKVTRTVCIQRFFRSKLHSLANIRTYTVAQSPAISLFASGIYYQEQKVVVLLIFVFKSCHVTKKCDSSQWDREWIWKTIVTRCVSTVHTQPLFGQIGIFLPEAKKTPNNFDPLSRILNLFVRPTKSFKRDIRLLFLPFMMTVGVASLAWAQPTHRLLAARTQCRSFWVTKGHPPLLSVPTSLV